MKLDAGHYTILLERGALARIGEEAAEVLRPGRAILVSDDRVFPLYGETVQEQLRKAGFSMGTPFIFPHGEAQKNWATLGGLLEHLAGERLTRSDVVFALGGGVTSDLAGFAAAVYLRGIRWIALPTSLLAAADASVGGKTAVDLGIGKNLAGAFHEPSLVLCDPAVFDTLPPFYYADGMAEIIKTAMLGDVPLWEQLQAGASPDVLLALAIRDKRDICAADLYDHGQRQKLNLGHTIGHALEAVSGYTIAHGHAVGAGLHAITKAAVQRHFCAPDVLDALDACLVHYGLDPFLCTSYAPEALLEAAIHDKKTDGDTVTLILPRDIGQADRLSLPLSALGDWIREGCAE